MPKTCINYSNAIIYKISCKNKEITNIYIGYTTNYIKRKYQHKISTECPNNITYNNTENVFIRKNGGWHNWKMSIIEKYPCQHKHEILKRYDEICMQHKDLININENIHTSEIFEIQPNISNNSIENSDNLKNLCMQKSNKNKEPIEFKCKYCDKHMSSKYKLQSHEYNICKYKLELKCDICLKIFKSKNYLNRHSILCKTN